VRQRELRSFVVNIISKLRNPFKATKKVAYAAVCTVGIGTLVFGAPLMARAASTTTTQNPSPAAQISFTFDDGLQSAYTQAAPTLAKYGLSGTDGVITSCVGMTKVPNTCRANTDAPYMTWAQVQAMQNTYGWEIASHTVDHDCLASNATVDPDDCQKATLTQAQVDTEMSGSKTALASYGINATDFMPPYGDYNNMVMAQIAKYYATMRQFKNANGNVNVWPYSDYYLWDYMVQEGTTPVSAVETAINNAIANKQWLILTFHDIQPTPSTNPDDYQYGTNELAQLAAYVQAKQQAGLINSVHVSQGLVSSSTNLLPNGNFAAGISNGWTTDNATDVKADTANNGSYPNSTYSVKVTTPAAGANVHLFSPKVAVNANTTYMYKNFLNVQSITSGYVGYYIDEYDANGNWVSGQWKTSENSSFVEDMNFTYKPTAANVSYASLQIIGSGAGINAYLANSQMFPLTSTAVNNMMPNGTFDAGITGGWSTDDATNIVADAGNNGSPNNPVNSVSMKSTTKNTHLFSPQISVTPSTKYNVTSYLNLKSISTNPGSEVGYYVDEYDASGNWISGKYLGGIHTVGVNNVGYTYTPSSASVAKVDLQVILVGNSGIQAYFDDVNWYAN
jgi:peptidoglycan/xylan/chitin deacetylase (PgdA/CDA1 family)